MENITRNIWLLLFIVWGLPLGYYRSKFRKMVYQTDSWTINVKPVFRTELKGLFGNLFPGNKQYIKFRNFYLFYLIIYAILFVVYLNIDNPKEVRVGDSIPSFELPDQHGNRFDLDSIIGEKNLVIFFYPKDDSPGCTKEACTFRDRYDVFRDADAMIIGISAQSVSSHLSFAEKHMLNYTLLSDADNRVRNAFGAHGILCGLIPGRITYVVNKNGKIVYRFNSQLQVVKHVDEALRILNQLK